MFFFLYRYGGHLDLPVPTHSVPTRRSSDLREVRRELERLIARCAARRATDAELLQFREIAEHLETAARANDSKVFMQQDRAFNILSASAARNEFLSGSMDLIHSLSRRFWYAFQQRVADIDRKSTRLNSSH